MGVVAIGLNYRTADISLLERAAIKGPRRIRMLSSLHGSPWVRGVVVVSTCNRTEIYVDAADDAQAIETMIDSYAASCKMDRAMVQPHLFLHKGTDAARHLFSVAASLESLVLGEQQIMGQLREAFKASSDNGCMSAMLHHLFCQALEVGKRVRFETAIGDNHVSVATCAVDLAKRAFGTLEGKQVLILGSGDMAEMVARYLLEQKATSLIVSSRTYAHACELANELGGIARRFDELGHLLESADIVISSTSAPHRILTPQDLAGMKHRIFLLDIAMPRDIDPACNDLSQVTLYDLHDLENIAAENRTLRQRAALEAEHIVEEETAAFASWVASFAGLPTIKALRAQAEQVRAHEVQHLIASIQADLSKEDRIAIEKATSAIVNKLLHNPIVRMKAQGQSDPSCIETVRFLFGLSEDQKTAKASEEIEHAAYRQHVV